MRTKKERRKLHIQKKNPNMLVPKKEKIKWQNKKNRKRKKKKRGSQHTLATERKNQRKKKKNGCILGGEFKRYFWKLISWAFLSQFSLYFGEKIFWWAQRENTWAPAFIFLPSHPTKHNSKSFSSHFLFKVFHPPYFTSKQTHSNFIYTVTLSIFHQILQVNDYQHSLQPIFITGSMIG